jgi:nucleoside phosphorylase
MDDSFEKIYSIKKFLTDECNIEDHCIEFASTIKDGRKLLYAKNFDLLLLDLVMPRDSENEPTVDESINFLDEIYYNSNIKIPIHIIGFSQYDQLIESKSAQFANKLWHLIYFSFSENSWKDQLKNKVCHLISTKEGFAASLEDSTKFDIGIICALDSPEFKEVLQLQCTWKALDIIGDPMVYYSGTLRTINGNNYKIIACAVNKMGMHASAIVSSMMINKFNIQYIFMTGMCAGIKGKELNYGDIIIAENTIDYGAGKLIEKDDLFEFKPEPHQLPSDQNLISKVYDFIRSKDELFKIQQGYKGFQYKTMLNAHVAPIASGSYVLSSKSFVSSIAKTNRKLLAIDMEGFGMYLACHYFNKTKPLFIKSICDFGDENKDDTFQTYASYTSAQFLYSFLFNML